MRDTAYFTAVARAAAVGAVCFTVAEIALLAAYSGGAAAPGETEVTESVRALAVTMCCYVGEEVPIQHFSTFGWVDLAVPVSLRVFEAHFGVTI